MIVDDEQDVESLFTQRFRKDLRSNNLEFHFAFSAEDALNYISTLNPIDIVLILSDINMPGKSGLDLLKEVKNKFPQFPGERSGVDCSENESTAETNGN